jgi:putative proteasome-type protease
MKFALKAGFLSFDATRISANDVDYPIDVVFYEKNSFKIVERRYKKDELTKISRNWNTKLSKSIDSIPDHWMEKLFSKVDTEEKARKTIEDALNFQHES